MKYSATLFIVIFSLAVFSSCGSGNSNPETGQFGGFRGGQATSVEVTPVQLSSISEQVRAYGSVRAQDVVSVTPQVSNRVTRILADLGDNVSRGQVLAEIHDVPFRENVEQARAQLRQAIASFERDSTQFSRQQEMYERNLISRQEYDDARTTYLNSRSQFESAQAALTQSLEDLENTKIKSPVNGVVLTRFIAEGDVASSGQPAFEVANLVGYETRVFLPMRDWQDIEVGQNVSMSLSSRGSEIARGVVSRKSPQLSTVTGLGEVVITLIDASSQVYQGALVQANINLQTREDVVVIPRSAMVEKVDTYIEPETGTIELERSYSAFVSQGDTIAVQRQLTLGIQQGDRIEILDGLTPGDRLIITGHRNLEDRSRIRVAGSEPSTLQQINAGTTANFQDMTPEQREQMRERMQNMTPEERQRMREQMGTGQGGGGQRANQSGSNN
ncbi:MAG: efflux RND transporter periplasmic adaptor subunit [Balneolaceae bacterium]|nr:MAG: efflux RND transporter periplasmic adaptor subunit [Balneolaceae bacterium]